MKYLLIIAIVLLASCSDPSIVHEDGDYTIIMTKETYNNRDWLSTYITRKGAIVYNSDLGFEEIHYIEINRDTLYSTPLDEDLLYFAPQTRNHRIVFDSLYRHVITIEDSLTYIYIDSLSICNELEKALARIESDKLYYLKDSTRRALRLAKIDSVLYWRNNVKEICKE